MRVELIYGPGESQTVQADSLMMNARNPGGSVRVDGQWRHGVNDVRVVEDGASGGLGGFF